VARQKFQKALALQTAGDWAGALALLKEVAEIKTTPQVLFNIALCEENLGQLVAALGDYELAAADARAAGIAAVEAEALQRLERLRTRIPRVRIERGAGASRATVTLGGVELGESALGRDLPIDPGSHEVRAVVPGRAPFVQELRVAEGEVAAVMVEFEPPSPPKPAPETELESGSGQRTFGFVSGGLGLAGLAAAGVFYALRYDAQQDLDALCPNRTACPAEGRPIAERGQQHTTYGNIALGVGVVGLATAAVLWLTDTSDEEQATSRTARRGFVSVGHPSAPLGATWTGSF
jgi:tetratricopeptide (TPR) repeat protein